MSATPTFSNHNAQKLINTNLAAAQKRDTPRSFSYVSSNQKNYLSRHSECEIQYAVKHRKSHSLNIRTHKWKMEIHPPFFLLFPRRQITKKDPEMHTILELGAAKGCFAFELETRRRNKNPYCRILNVQMLRFYTNRHRPTRVSGSRPNGVRTNREQIGPETEGHSLRSPTKAKSFHSKLKRVCESVTVGPTKGVGVRVRFLPQPWFLIISCREKKEASSEPSEMTYSVSILGQPVLQGNYQDLSLRGIMPGSRMCILTVTRKRYKLTRLHTVSHLGSARLGSAYDIEPA